MVLGRIALYEKVSPSQLGGTGTDLISLTLVLQLSEVSELTNSTKSEKGILF